MKNISTNQRYLVLGAFALAAVTMFFLSKSDSNAKQDVPRKRAVGISTAKEADKNMALEISGFVRGEGRADVAPMVSGRILRILKHEGESVKKGDVIATIEAGQADAQVEAASASVEALQKTVDASKKYYNQLVDQAKEAPDSDANDEAIKSAKRARDLQIQAAKDQLVAAQGALGIAQAGKNNSTITAPFSGVITAVYGREGGNASASVPIANISTQNSKEIETYVSAANGRSISVGTIATMQASNGQPISGIVTAVSAGSDTQSLKTLVRIHIEDALDTVYLGDFLRGEIMILRQKKSVSIPRKAVISRSGDQIVFVLDENDVAKEQLVKIGSEHDGLVDVEEGMSANQRVVVDGQQYLTNGMPTEPYEAK